MQYQVARALAQELFAARQERGFALAQIIRWREQADAKEADIPEIDAVIAEYEALLGADADRLVEEMTSVRA